MYTADKLRGLDYQALILKIALAYGVLVKRIMGTQKWKNPYNIRT